jgi:hypothetical protein
MPVTKSVAQAGAPFVVDITVDKVDNLFGLAFVLQYTNPRSVTALAVEKGTLLGNDVLFYSNIDKQNGLVSIGISRKGPDAGGVNDSGVVARIKFRSMADASPGTLTNLKIKEVTAKEPNGDSIFFETPASAKEAAVALRPMPDKFSLLANFPNPFNPETWIPFELSESAEVQISIYDVSGRLVRIIDLGHKPIGAYTSRNTAAYWDGKNSIGEVVSSGIYLYTIQAGNFTATRKMLVVR